MIYAQKFTIPGGLKHTDGHNLPDSPDFPQQQSHDIVTAFLIVLNQEESFNEW